MWATTAMAETEAGCRSWHRTTTDATTNTVCPKVCGGWRPATTSADALPTVAGTTTTIGMTGVGRTTWRGATKVLVFGSTTARGATRAVRDAGRRTTTAAMHPPLHQRRAAERTPRSMNLAGSGRHHEIQAHDATSSGAKRNANVSGRSVDAKSARNAGHPIWRMAVISRRRRRRGATSGRCSLLATTLSLHL